MNRIYITGRIGQDAELKKTQKGFSIATTSVAESKKLKDGFQTRWFDVVLFGDTAERYAEKIKKGLKVFIEGEMDQSKYTDKEGKTRYGYKIIGHIVEIIHTEKYDNGVPVGGTSARPEDFASHSSVDDLPF